MLLPDYSSCFICYFPLDVTAFKFSCQLPQILFRWDINYPHKDAISKCSDVEKNVEEKHAIHECFWRKYWPIKLGSIYRRQIGSV